MDSFKLESLSEDIFTHSSSEVGGGVDDAGFTNANTQFTCSADSDDDGSMLVVRTMRLRRRCFSCAFRSERDVDSLLKAQKPAEHADSEPKPNTFRDTPVLDQQTAHHDATNLNSASDGFGGLLAETDSDGSGSLESVGSDEGSDFLTDVNTEVPLLQSIGQKRKRFTPSNFGNHALLQNHLNYGLPTTSTPSLELAQKRKISQNASKTAASARKKGRQLVLQTQAEKDAYIMTRVSRWQSTGKGLRSGWSDLARRMNTTTHAVRKRWKELSQRPPHTTDPLDAVPAAATTASAPTTTAVATVSGAMTLPVPPTPTGAATSEPSHGGLRRSKRGIAISPATVIDPKTILLDDMAREKLAPMLSENPVRLFEVLPILKSQRWEVVDLPHGESYLFTPSGMTAMNDAKDQRLGKGQRKVEGEAKGEDRNEMQTNKAKKMNKYTYEDLDKAGVRKYEHYWTDHDFKGIEILFEALREALNEIPAYV